MMMFMLMKTNIFLPSVLFLIALLCNCRCNSLIQNEIVDFVQQKLPDIYQTSFSLDSFAFLNETLISINLTEKSSETPCTGLLKINTESSILELETIKCSRPNIDDEIQQNQQMTNEKPQSCPNCPFEIDRNSESATKLLATVIDHLKLDNGNLTRIEKQIVYTGGVRYYLTLETFENNRFGKCLAKIFSDNKSALFTIEKHSCEFNV